MWYRRKLQGEKDPQPFTWHDCINCPNFPSKDGSFEEMEISNEDHRDLLEGKKQLPNGGVICKMCKKKRKEGHCRPLLREVQTNA